MAPPGIYGTYKLLLRGKGDYRYIGSSVNSQVHNSFFFFVESQKSVLAKEANALRKKLLGEVRAGLVRSGSGKWESDSNDLEHLEKVITDAFQDAMDSKLDHRSS